MAKTGNALAFAPKSHENRRPTLWPYFLSPPSLAIASRTRTSAFGIALLKHRKIITSATKCMLVEMSTNTLVFGDSQVNK